MIFRDYLEGKRLHPNAMSRESVPSSSTPELIEGWQVWFVNKSGVPQGQFEVLKSQDMQMIKKIIAVLRSIGVRKHNRVPIVLSYERNDMDSGSYKSSDDYLVIYRDPNQSLETIVGTIAHEIGHGIYNKLPEDEYAQIKANAGSIGSFTKYTDPNFSSGEGHESGNEWFADYVAATVMKGFGLAPDTKVGSWEPINDPKRGMSAVRKTLGNQAPGRTGNKSAAAFKQKNWWMFDSVKKILAAMGDKPITVGSLGLPTISAQLGPDTTVKEVLGEFLSVMNGRLEQLPPADRHTFLKAAYHTALK